MASHGHANTGNKDLIGVDSDITRNRFGRVLFFLVATFLIFSLPALGIEKVIQDWFGVPLWGMATGLALGGYLYSKILDKFFVKVESARGFLTTNSLAALLGRSQDIVYVAYGPGWHFAYPWELRETENNISLEEGSQPFQMVVMGTTGEINVSGSARLRPSLTKLIEFRSGVASAADDLVDIIKAFILKQLTGKSLDDVQKSLKDLNEKLHTEFAKDSEVVTFESRFGVTVGDVTVSELLPSAEVRKTRNAIDEAIVIADGTAILLGFASRAEMQQALKEKKISQADANTARDRFMAASDNMKMNLNATEISLKIDAHPDIVDALGNAAPALAAAAAAFAPKQQTSQKGK